MANRIAINVLPSTVKYIGVALPTTESVGGGFKQTTSTLEQARYNIINLIQTERGERIYRPDYGVSIKKWIFENFTNGTTDIDDFIIDDMRSAIKKWLPYVTVTGARAVVEPDNNKLSIQIEFYIYDNKFSKSQINAYIDL